MNNDLTSTAQRKVDAELVCRALEGNEDAFTALFNAHRTRVYSLCLRMTSNTAEAEDLTQDVFFHLFRKLGTFRGDSALSTWLYRVAVNTVLMRFRKKGPRQVSLEEAANNEARAPKREHGKADDRLRTSVDRIALTRAMKELPVGYRTIFLMHEVRGYEHHEIARLLRCAVGNSKSQLHKAKARMRELLGIQKMQDGRGTAKKGFTAVDNPVSGETVSFGQPVEPSSWQHQRRQRSLFKATASSGIEIPVSRFVGLLKGVVYKLQSCNGSGTSGTVGRNLSPTQDTRHK